MLKVCKDWLVDCLIMEWNGCKMEILFKQNF